MMIKIKQSADWIYLADVPLLQINNNRYPPTPLGDKYELGRNNSFVWLKGYVRLL